MLVDPTDVDAVARAIDRVLQDVDLYLDLAARGRRRAKMFSWQRAARETTAIYRAVMGTNDGNTPYGNGYELL